MGIDFYEKAYVIAGIMRSEGLDKSADELTESIQSCFTATEALMAIRFNLQKVVAENIGSVNLRYRISELIAGIEEVIL